MNWHKKPNVQTYNTITRKWDLREYNSQVDALAAYVKLSKLGCKASLFYGSVAYKEPQ